MSKKEVWDRPIQHLTGPGKRVTMALSAEGVVVGTVRDINGEISGYIVDGGTVVLKMSLMEKVFDYFNTKFQTWLVKKPKKPRC